MSLNVRRLIARAGLAAVVVGSCLAALCALTACGGEIAVTPSRAVEMYLCALKADEVAGLAAMLPASDDAELAEEAVDGEPAEEAGGDEQGESEQAEGELVDCEPAEEAAGGEPADAAVDGEPADAAVDAEPADAAGESSDTASSGQVFASWRSATEKGLLEKLSRKALDFDYVVAGEQIAGEDAWVTVRFTTYDFAAAFEGAVQDAQMTMVARVLEKQDDPQTGATRAANALYASFEKRVSQLDTLDVTTETTFHVVRDDGAWVVEELTEDNISALLGGWPQESLAGLA